MSDSTAAPGMHGAGVNTHASVLRTQRQSQYIILGGPGVVGTHNKLCLLGV